MFLWVWMEASGKKTFDSLDDRNCEQPGCKLTRAGPVAITRHIPPLDLDRAKRCDDGGSLEALVRVEDNGRDAFHETTRARHTGEGTSGSLVFGVGSDLQALDRPERGSDRLNFAGTGFLVAVDGFEFHGEITQQVESFVELVSDEQGHVDGFFRWCFLVVGCW